MEWNGVEGSNSSQDLLRWFSTYARYLWSSINTQSFIGTSCKQHSFLLPSNFNTVRFFNNGKTPFIDIFDARVASENHRSIIRAWPTARAASCSKAWLHHLTHCYPVLSHLVYGVFFWQRRFLFLIILSFRIEPILVKNIWWLRDTVYLPVSEIHTIIHLLNYVN